MLNTVSSKKQRMTTVWGDNTGPGQPFFSGQNWEEQKPPQNPETSQKETGHRPTAVCCVCKSFGFLLRSSVGHTLSETQKVKVGRKKQEKGKEKKKAEEMWFLFHSQSFKDVYLSFGYRQAIIAAVNVHLTRVLAGEKYVNDFLPLDGG